MTKSAPRLAAVLVLCLTCASLPAAARPGGGYRGGGGLPLAPTPHGSPFSLAPRIAPYAAPSHFAPYVTPSHVVPRFTAPAAPRISAPRIAPAHIAPPIAHFPSAAPFAPQHFARPAPFAQSPSTTGRIPPEHMSGGGAHWIAAPAFEQGGAFGFARNRAAFGRPFIPGAFRSGFLLRSPYAHWPRFARAYFRGGFGRHHDRSRGSIGWDGSLFWPYGYDDLLDYTLYPYAYDAFWPYAYDELYRGMSVLGSSSIGSAYATTGEPTANRAPVVDAGHVCTADVSSLTDWRINALADRMDLDETQRAARDELEAATARALPMLKAACPHGLPSTPIQRMDAMHAQVAAMLSTVRAVRAPLAVFYNLLHAPQKARLDALGAGESRRPQIARDLAGICREHSARVAGAPIERIERAVRPSDTQQASLQHLAASLTAAGDVLRSNCAGTDANSAVLRLEAIEHRLDAMLRAVEIVQPALEEFYGVLSPEQKRRFNSLTATAG